MRTRSYSSCLEMWFYVLQVILPFVKKFFEIEYFLVFFEVCEIGKLLQVSALSRYFIQLALFHAQFSFHDIAFLYVTSSINISFLTPI
jgi:hypothetical protein